MQIFRALAVSMRSADATTFTGSARTVLLASSVDAPIIHVYRVEFDAGGRTNWHRHSGPQWLLVIEGRIRVQRWGEPAADVETGDAVMFAPGEKHWHGSVEGGRGTHLAVNINVTTEWLEPVTDAQYHGIEP